MQQRGEFVGERAAIEAQLTKLHHDKSMLKIERALIVNLTNARARARDIAITINREGAQRPAVTRANQNMAVASMLLDTLLTPSTNRVDKVYCQLKDILGIAAA
jgi:hypothetical protein